MLRFSIGKATNDFLRNSFMHALFERMDTPTSFLTRFFIVEILSTSMITSKLSIDSPIALSEFANFSRVAEVGRRKIRCCFFRSFSVIAAVYVVILQAFPTLEKKLKQRSDHFELHLELKSRNDLPQFMTTLRELGMRIDDVEMNSAFINSGLSVYSLKLTIESKELKKYKTHDEIIEALRSIDYIHYVEEK